MPLTVTTSAGNGHIGPGIFVNWTSDFVGPLAVGSSINLYIYSDTDGTNTTIQSTLLTQNKNGTFPIMIRGYTGDAIPQGQLPVAGNPTLMQVILSDQNGNPLQVYSATPTWSDTEGLGMQTYQQQVTVQGGSGLTAQQAAQLQTVTDAVQTTQVTETGTTTVSLGELFSQNTLDTLTLQEITSGPTFDFVGANLTVWWFGVVVRITNIPNDVAPLTPDGDYYPADLAVVRIFHNQDLWLRRPIHTTSQIVTIERSKETFIIEGLERVIWPQAVTLQVTWRRGVAGQVFRLFVP